ncbi:MAG: hypothetical protein AAF197_08785, partial [Pseudomonadota bacterium]
LGFYTLTAPQFLSYNAFLVILLGFFAAHIWKRLDKQGVAISGLLKLSLSYLFLFVAFCVLVFAIQTTSQDALVPTYWILFALSFVAASELFADPVILSAIYRQVPREFVGTVMGAYYVSIAVALYGASWVATKIVPKTGDGGSKRVLTSLEFVPGYLGLAVLSLLGFIFLLVPTLVRAWNDRFDRDSAS